MKKILKYKNALILFSVVLITILAFYMQSLYKSLIKFEANDIDNYITTIINNLKEKEYINKYLKDEKITNNFEQNVSKLDAFIKAFNDDNIKYIKVDNNVYELSNNKNRLATLTLKENKEENVLGLLTYTPLDIESITFDQGIYNLQINANSTYKVYVNGILLDNNYVKEVKEYPELNRPNIKELTPKIFCYEIKDLLKKPEIKIITSNGDTLSRGIKDNIVEAKEPSKYESYDEAKDYIKNNFNPLELAKNWSLYLTADLNGRNGFYILQPNLLKGTDLYTRARNWSIHYDINFTSPHTLADNPFTDITMNNFKFYSDNFFTVDIKLKKNMILSNGMNKSDELNETFYFKYIDNNYKLIDMKSIEA